MRGDQARHDLHSGIESAEVGGELPAESRAIGADPAVAHDLELPLPRRCRRQSRRRRRRARPRAARRSAGRWHPAPARQRQDRAGRWRARKYREGQGGADQRADHGNIRCARTKFAGLCAVGMRHRQPRQERHGGFEIVEPFIHGDCPENWSSFARPSRCLKEESHAVRQSRRHPRLLRDLPGGDAALRRYRRPARQTPHEAARQPWPPGSARGLARAWQARAKPRLERVRIGVRRQSGVTSRGVSAYPPAATAQMVANFAAGGAAINQSQRLANAKLRVIPIDLDRPTRDFTENQAMTRTHFSGGRAGYRPSPGKAICWPRRNGDRNTTAAATLWAACSAAKGHAGPAAAPASTTRAGSASSGYRCDARICIGTCSTIRSGDRNGARRTQTGRDRGRDPAARHQAPVLLDGFVAPRRCFRWRGSIAGGLDHCRAGHVSAKSGRRVLLRRTEARAPARPRHAARRGVGRGVAVLLARAALACHAGMATFAEAGVAGAGD